MPKSVEINIKKVRYEELLDITERDLSKIIKQKSRFKDKMIVSIVEFLLSYGAYQVIAFLGSQEYAEGVVSPFKFLSELMCIALFARTIYYAVRLFVIKHPTQKKYMSCDKVIDLLKKDCVKYREQIAISKKELEEALIDEADERGVTLNEKIKAFESSGSRAYSFYEDILPEEEERARRERENAPSDIELAIMKGFVNKDN